MYQRFGEDRVATVCTINRFRSRSALREVAKGIWVAGRGSEPPGRQPALPLVRPVQPRRQPGRSICRAARTLSYPNPPGDVQGCSRIDRRATPPLRPPRRGGHQPGTTHRPGTHPGGEQRAWSSPSSTWTRSNAWDWSRLTCWGSRGLTVLGDVVEIIAKERPAIKPASREPPC